MNYNILNNISDAFIIVHLKTATVEYFNEQAKVLLKIASGYTVKASKFFKNKNQWYHFKKNAVDFLSKNTVNFSRTCSIRTCANTCFSTILKCGYADETKKTIYVTFCSINASKNNDVDFHNFAEMTLSGLAIVTMDEFLTIKYANNAFYEIIELDTEQCKGLYSLLSNIYSEDTEMLIATYKK